MEKVLKSDRVRLVVSDFGAEMTSLTLDGFEYLWSPNELYYNRTSPCLFPILGRFLDGYYTHNGKQYPMQLNGVALEKTFKILSASENEIVLELREDEDTLAVYPFQFTLIIRYRLVGQRLHVSYTVYNRSNEPMPYSVGNHTAYSWPLVEQDNPNSYFLRFEQAETLESFSPFGLTAPWLTNEYIRPLSHDLYVNGTRSFRDQKSEWFEYTGANCDFVVRMYRESFHFVANWASPDENAKIICLEPSLSISNHGPTMFDREGVHVIEPGSSETVSYSLELYRKSEKTVQ